MRLMRRRRYTAISLSEIDLIALLTPTIIMSLRTGRAIRDAICFMLEIANARSA